MKRLLFLFAGAGALLCAADLETVHNVYVMPMARGLDQYLASRLTSDQCCGSVSKLTAKGRVVGETRPLTACSQ